ncbi:MAG: electron transfer flavoprotein subunit alpha [Opitutaceae bacterium]|jgi:electron transfer flavoprotein alpha subunit
MSSILFLAHTEADALLSKHALEALAAAQSLRSSLSDSALLIGIIGADTTKAADQIATAGAARILAVSGPEFGQSRYSTDILAVEAVCKAAAATYVVAPATSRWNRVMAGAAQRLGGRIDSHATAISVNGGAPAVNRWFYRQRMEGVVTRTKLPWFILLEAGCVPAYSGAPGSATVEPLGIAPAASNLRTSVSGIRAPAADEQTIRPDAKLLFVAGAGWTKKQADGQTHAPEAEQLILGFLRKSKASLGSTKSLVDLSGEGQAVLKFMTHLNQVGQTGSTPRHPKGLATCCHGEEPHTVGWRFINERRAINLNPGCSWAQGKADVLYVADSFAVMRKVNELLTT